jgi:hypothetical protein
MVGAAKRGCTCCLAADTRCTPCAARCVPCWHMHGASRAAVFSCGRRCTRCAAWFVCAACVTCSVCVRACDAIPAPDMSAATQLVGCATSRDSRRTHVPHSSLLPLTLDQKRGNHTHATMLRDWGVTVTCRNTRDDARCKQQCRNGHPHPVRQSSTLGFRSPAVDTHARPMHT